MAIDEFQRQQRKKFLGSSDAPALAGVDPFGRNQVDVWLEKTGKLAPVKQGRRELNSPKIVGTYLEPSILSWVEDVLGSRLARDQFKIHANGIMCADFDALALAAAPPAVVEAKVCGMFGRPSYFDGFGEPMTDEVPDHVRVQVHHQLAVAQTQKDLPRMDLVLVPVLLVSRGFVLYKIPRNDDLCDALVELEEDFWRRYVEKDEQPSDIASLASLKRLVRWESSPVEIDHSLVIRWQSAKEAVKQAEIAQDDAARELIMALGTAERGVCNLGTISYLEQTRAGCEVPETTFRVLRFQKPKPEKGGKRR